MWETTALGPGTKLPISFVPGSTRCSSALCLFKHRFHTDYVIWCCHKCIPWLIILIEYMGLIIHRVNKMFDWFAGDGFRCSSALCSLVFLYVWSGLHVTVINGDMACYWYNHSVWIIGPILDDRLKENILKPWKGALSSHSVCLSVCVCAGCRSHLLT